MLRIHIQQGDIHFKQHDRLPHKQRKRCQIKLFDYRLLTHLLIVSDYDDGVGADGQDSDKREKSERTTVVGQSSIVFQKVGWRHYYDANEGVFGETVATVSKLACD